MKCNNCGWSNNNDGEKCIKCGAALGKSDMANVDPNFKGTIVGQQSNAPDKKFTAETERRSAENIIIEANSLNIPVSKMINCPACGYLSISQVINCPKCGSLLEPAGDREHTVQIEPSVSTEGNITVSPISAFSGTIDPYRQKTNTKKEIFLLKLEATEAENELLAFEANEDDIELNRANLDRDNKGITARLQATLSCLNGSWFIQDQSEYKTTFIQVAEKHELKNGDILLIGNKKFIFYTEEPNA